jgi:hypothetical protein
LVVALCDIFGHNRQGKEAIQNKAVAQLMDTINLHSNAKWKSQGIKSDSQTRAQYFSPCLTLVIDALFDAWTPILVTFCFSGRLSFLIPSDKHSDKHKRQAGTKISGS